MQFQYQAMTSGGAIMTDVVEAASQHEAADELRRKGLMVMRLEAAEGDTSRRVSLGSRRGRVHAGDLLLFARQMKMLLEAGAAVVPALLAIEQQAAKPALRALIRSIREDVEGGGTLAEALEKHPRVFKSVFISTIAAGEASATLPQAFDRLSMLTNAQMQVRRAVVSAVTYPALLTMLCVGVVSLMIGFVVPRFKQLFANLNSPLPMTTKIMFNLADFVRDSWPLLLIGAAAK
ncbi:MAG: type II secretion system F family protein, partial [Planctomycetota bacterium]